jgi:hypothetical protein
MRLNSRSPEGVPPPRVICNPSPTALPSRLGVNKSPATASKPAKAGKLDLLDSKGVDFFESVPFEAQGKKESRHSG